MLRSMKFMIGGSGSMVEPLDHNSIKLNIERGKNAANREVSTAQKSNTKPAETNK